MDIVTRTDALKDISETSEEVKELNELQKELDEEKKVSTERNLAKEVSLIFYNELKKAIKNKVYTRIGKVDGENTLTIKISSYGIKWSDTLVLCGNTLEKLAEDPDYAKTIVKKEIGLFKATVMDAFFA